jgi:pilus assembly protein CpaE
MAALLIAPDRKIAESLRATATEAGTFEIVTDLQTYPAPETIETRMRQARAEVLLIDVATNLETAAAIIKHASSLNPQPPVIALHSANDSGAILRSLRCGAHEFFHAPFDASVQEAAITRLSRIFEASGAVDRDRGHLVVFTGAKSGSGVSTLALQTANALKQSGASRKVLLADLNLQGGSLRFLLDIEHPNSVADLIGPGVRNTRELWSQAIAAKDGLQAVLEWARGSYDWIIADLPVVFQRVSLVCMSGADHLFLVCTPQLASLHLTRRAVKLLQQLEFDSSRLQVLINRIDGKSDLSSSDLSKIFDCRVDRSLPDDRDGISGGLRRGGAADAGSAIGRAVGSLAGKLAGAPAEKRRAAPIPSRRTADAHA